MYDQRDCKKYELTEIFKVQVKAHLRESIDSDEHPLLQ